MSNIARGNRCRDGVSAAHHKCNFPWSRRMAGAQNAANPEGGIVMAVIENNRFDQVINPIHVTPPAN